PCTQQEPCTPSRHPLNDYAGTTPVEVAYAFDEGVSNTLGNPDLFGFYTTASGDTSFHAATQVALTSSGSNAVVAQFSSADQAILSAGGASDFVVLDGAVEDGLGNPNPIGTSGGSTELPDLVATGFTPPNTWSFTFNTAVTVANQNQFHVFDAGGIAYDASSAPTLSNENKTVAMQFTPVDATDADPNEVTLETVDPGAVQSTASTPVPGAAGALPVTPVADAAGDTSGPDLTGFTINTTTGDITYTFDKAIGSVPSPAGFEAVDAAGDQVPAPDQTTTTGGLLGIGGTTTTTPPVYTINGSSVTVSFATQSSTSSGTGGLLGLGGLGLGGLLGGGGSSTPSTSAATDAVGVIVEPGSVEDASGSNDPNPLGSLGLNPAPITPPTNTNPTTTSATTTAAATTPPAKAPGSSCVSTRVIVLNLKSLVSKKIESATVTVDGKKVSLPGKTTVINGKKTFTPTWTVKISLAPYHKTVTVKITAKYKAKVKVKKKVKGKTKTVTETKTKTAHQTHKYNPC
ncbi:MAG TPA: hypothetical protein VHX88_15110, partial [Solirubrobacteraceae bacterium]|nr:hypothetical protein [Solirubrobacteraceae bacterium]